MGRFILRKIRKIKYSRLFLIIVLFYILLQIFINIIGKNISTLVLESEVTSLNITEKGLIIRDEYLIKSNQNGYIKTIAREGEKLRKGDTVASIYNNSKIAWFRQQQKILSCCHEICSANFSPSREQSRWCLQIPHSLT